MPHEPRFQTVDTLHFVDGQFVAWDEATARFVPSDVSIEKLLGFTEAVQDAAAPLFTGSETILESYNDEGNRVALEVNTSVIARLDSPVFSGTPTAPTAALGTNTNQIATMAAIKAAIDALLDGAPGALDTLNEIAEQLADDQDAVAALVATLATEITNRQNGDAGLQAQIDARAPLAGWLLEWNDTGAAAAFDPATLVPVYRTPVFGFNGDLRLGSSTTTRPAWSPFAGGCSARLTTQFFVAGNAAKTISLDVSVDNAAKFFLTLPNGTRAQVGTEVTLGNGTVVITMTLQPGWNLLEVGYANTGGFPDGYYLRIVGHGAALHSLVDAMRAPISTASSANAVQIQGVPVAATVPADGQVQVYNSSTNQYEPGSVAAGGVGGGNSDVSLVAGEAIATRSVLLAAISGGEHVGGRAYLTSSDSAARSTQAILAGIAKAAAAAGALVAVQRDGIVGGFADQTPGAIAYVGASGALTTVAPQNARRAGVFISATELLLDYVPASTLAPYFIIPMTGLVFRLGRGAPGTGTVWKNTATTGVALNGTLVSPAAWGVTNGVSEVRPNGAGITSSAGRVSIANNTALQNLTGLTAAIWVRKASQLIKPMSHVGGGSGFFLAERGSAMTFTVNTSAGSASITTGLTASSGLHLYVATWDGATMKVYKDGAVGSTTATLGGNYGVPNSALLLGTEYDATEGQDGGLVEAFFYNRALSQSEVTQLYQSTV